MLKYLILIFLFLGANAEFRLAVAEQINTKNRMPCGGGIVKYKAQSQSSIPNFNAERSFFHRANIGAQGLQSGQLSVTFVGHSTFLIRSPQDIRVITDYNDHFRADLRPDIITMDVRGRSHSTNFISPNISHVLRGWTEALTPQRHDVTLKDVRVYNLPTNIMDFGAGFSNFSSVFIIQSQGLCIAHMGHLQHVLDQQALSGIGRIDVLLIPIDHRITQSYKELIHNIKGINPRLLIPMHFDAMPTAETFISDISKIYTVNRSETDTMVLSRSTLPIKTEVLLLSPQRPGSKLGSRL